MTQRFEIVRDPVLGEEVWLARTSHGLPLRLVPTDRFREIVAVATFGYGSTDLGFVLDGKRHVSPEGVAHYLEHKLFEDEDLHVFERFGRRGARVNAMTGFTRTTYYFQAVSELEANLSDLLRLCTRAHLTDENVEKERGIIAQELRMYEDSPEYRGFFAALGGLYSEHPVRHPVGGTVASIARIDVAELLACHRAFYRTGNAALAVAGPIDPEAVLDLAEACGLAEGKEPERLFPADLGPADGEVRRMKMEVSRPRLLLVLKDRSLIDDPEQRARRELATRLLLDRLFGSSSEIREDLHARGLVDDSLSASYLGERTFGFAVVACETEQPDAVAEELKALLLRDVEVDADHIERVRRRFLGQFVRSFDSLQAMAFGHAEEQIEGVVPFGALQRMQTIDAEDVVARRRELCRDDAIAVAIVEP